VAVLAIKVYDVFVEPGDESGATGHASSDLHVARAVMEVNERFEAARATAQASTGAEWCGAAAVGDRQDEPDG